MLQTFRNVKSHVDLRELVRFVNACDTVHLTRSISSRLFICLSVGQMPSFGLSKKADNENLMPTTTIVRNYLEAVNLQGTPQQGQQFEIEHVPQEL